MNGDGRLWKAKQIAARYQVKVATVTRWHREGKIRAAVNVGKVLRFAPQVVAEDLAAASARENGVLVI